MNFDLTELVVAGLFPIGCSVVMPIVIVWLVMKRKANETNKRAELVKFAIEHNTQVDVANLIEQLSGSKAKNLKERLLTRLQWGCISTASGLAILVYSLWMDYKGGMATDDLSYYYLASGIALLIGIALIILFFISKKMLKQEIEAETKEKTTPKN